MARFLARIRMPLVYTAVLWVVFAAFLGAPAWIPVVILVIALAIYFRLGTVHAAPITVAPPVEGPWRAINSPADRVPSHGLHAYGQTYAIDLLYAPDGKGEIDVGWWPVTRPADDFPGFGQHVLAPIAGEVVAAFDQARDHRARTSWPALVYMFTLGALFREAGGPRGILGNHVVIRGDDCVYALVAHLEHASLFVERGQQVAAGDVIGLCGNSGNSSEPHVHFQLMDRPSTLVAAGLPFRFDHYEVDGIPTDGVPDTSHVFVAGTQPAARG